MTNQSSDQLNEKVEKLFDLFFNKIKKEWKTGFKSIQKNLEKINSYKDQNSQKLTYIRDPLWGEIILNPLEKTFLDSFFIQRLRNIVQMGGARYVYPSANHKRFDHSLGTFGAISLILDEKLFKRRSQFFKEKILNSYKGLKNYFLEESKNFDDLPYGIDKLGESIDSQLEFRAWINSNLKISMLLHDIGHYPFSHAFEVFLSTKENIVKQYRKKWRNFPSAPHEERGKEMILGEDEIINEFFSNYSSVFKIFFTRIKLDCDLIAKSITDECDYCLSRLINGPLDADKMDYLARDYYFTMAPSHLNTFDRIYRLARIEEFDGDYKLIFKEKAISAIIKIILTRTFEFNDVVNHPLQLCFQGMFIACLDKVLQKFEANYQITILKRWELMNDHQLLESISILSENEPLIEKLLYGIKNRVFYKEVMILSKSDLFEFISSMEASNLDSIFIEGGKMKQIYSQDLMNKISIPLKKIVNDLISKMEKEYGILIFYHKENKKFNNYFDKILIQYSESKEIVSLHDYIIEKFRNRRESSKNSSPLNFKELDNLNILEKIDNGIMVYSDVHIKEEVTQFFYKLKETPHILKIFLALTLD